MKISPWSSNSFVNVAYGSTVICGRSMVKPDWVRQGWGLDDGDEGDLYEDGNGFQSSFKQTLSRLQA